MVHAHGVVGRDRPVEERERTGAAAALAQLVEGPLRLPALEHGALQGGVIRLGRDSLEYGLTHADDGAPALA